MTDLLIITAIITALIPEVAETVIMSVTAW